MNVVDTCASRILVAACTMLAAGCGGSPPPVAEEPLARERNPQTESEPEDGAEITGILGAISQEQVQGALEPRMMVFQRCIAQRSSEIEYLAGAIQLAFHIRRDGTVLWVYPSESTLGDVQTESCIVQAASAVRFARPRGGEAEFTWGFAYDAPQDVRPALNWDASQASNALADGSTAAITQCGLSGVRVTAYVAPGGRVVAAGAAADSSEALQSSQCIADAVRGWTFPDPGSYAAKLTFAVVPVERPTAPPGRRARNRRR